MIALLFRVLRPGHRRHIAALLFLVAGFVVIGGALFAHAHRPELPVTSGWYWALTTATTVGYGDVTPDSAAGRVIASLVMLTTIPMLASVFALATAGTAAAGIRRILAMHSRFPASPYRLVIGMNATVPAILARLVAAGVSVVLVADVDPGNLPPEVHLVRGEPTDEAAIRSGRPEGAEQALITGKSDGDVQADMLAELVEANSHQLSEITADQAVIGKPLSAVRDERAGLVLGLVLGGRFTLGLTDDPVIQAGDALLVADRLAAASKTGSGH